MSEAPGAWQVDRSHLLVCFATTGMSGRPADAYAGACTRLASTPVLTHQQILTELPDDSRPQQ